MPTPLRSWSLGRLAWWRWREEEKGTRPPWVSVAAGLQAHVCGGCFLLCNKLLEVHEVADGGEASASRAGRVGTAGEQGPAGRRHAGRPLARSGPRVLAHFPRWGVVQRVGRNREHLVLLEARFLSPDLEEMIFPCFSSPCCELSFPLKRAVEGPGTNTPQGPG